MQIRIGNLVENLSNRSDGGSSKRFFDVYGRFVRAYLDYMVWMEEMIAKNGQYRGAITDNDRHELCVHDIDIIRWVGETLRGDRSPIEYLPDDGFGIEIDGYHRLVIMGELGEEEIACK